MTQGGGFVLLRIGEQRTEFYIKELFIVIDDAWRVSYSHAGRVLRPPYLFRCDLLFGA